MKTHSKRITKTTRFEPTLVHSGEKEAAQLGLTFNDIVEIALADYLSMPKNPVFDMLETVRDYLLREFPDRQGFPQDVTLQVFKFIRNNKDTWSLYEAATTDGEGQLVEALRDSLHRRIGKAVKSVLEAKVVGRSLPLDPTVELISSHALLTPSGGTTKVQPQ